MVTRNQITNALHALNEAERTLFAALPDYHWIFERVIIDPPYAAVAWKMTGISQEQNLGFELQGSSQFEFADDGKVAKYWLYGDMSQLSAVV